MKKANVNGYILELYDSIEEMPIINFQKYNKFVLVDSGLGSDIDSVDQKLINLARLIKSDKAKAQQELQNLRQTMHLIVSGVSPKHLAFAALIHSIDGVRVTDLSDSNLKEILTKLKSIRQGWIAKFLEYLKKKLDTELNTYFPNSFGDNAKEKSTYDKIRQRTLLILESIIGSVDNSRAIAEINNALFQQYKPKSFIGPNSVEVLYDKQFELSCIYISQTAHMQAKQMTVLEFYTTLEELKKQADLKMKAYKKH